MNILLTVIKNYRSHTFILLAIFLAVANISMAEVTLPKLVSDHMVLQRDKQLPIWGWADPGENVTILFQNQNITTRTDESGKWSIILAATPAGGPYDMVISGTNTIRLKDIMVGDVWVCSGQSNMEWKLGWLKEQYASEIATSKNNNIRQIEVERRTAGIPVEDIKTSGWKLARPETVEDFTAVGYFFAKRLNEEYNVPIGLIYTTWGGTVAEAWTSPETLMKFPEFQDEMKNRIENSLEDAIQSYQKDLEIWNDSINKVLSKSKKHEKNWTSVKFDDKSWNTMTLPALWESAGLKDFDGVVWFRKSIQIPKHLSGKDLTVSLGPIDDADSTFFNGQFIGKMSRYNEFREYHVPGKFVKAGNNVIVTRVIDTGGGGGIYGKTSDMVVKTENEEIPLHGAWKYNVAVDFMNMPKDPNDPNKPAVLFNGMIAPIIPFAIKGVIWYQGESNANRAKQYQILFPAMIQDWRHQWRQGEFPFLFVQLANYMEPKEEPSESKWAELREAQLKTLSVDNTGMAVIIDIGEAGDIHPKNKHDVGNRLALAARKIAYNEEIVYSGPIYDSMEIAGDTIKIKFKHIGSGLVCKGNELKEFAIAGEDNKFYKANAVISNDEVLVTSDKVKQPVSVRYAWADNPEGANLFNKEGLPASPFRTDE